MEQGSNFKRNNLLTVQQIRYLQELKRMGSRRGCVGMVADICGVNHGSVSRFFRTCCDNGWLTEDFQLTEAGNIWLDSYLGLQEGLKDYLRQIGIAPRDMEENVRSLIENVSYDTLAAMLRGSRSLQGTRAAEKKEQNIVKDIIEYGTHQVYFVLFRQDRQSGYAASMADRGFRKPGVLRHSRRGSYLELKICEMTAVSRINGQLMAGHLETLKYEKDGMMQKAVMRDGKIRIPLEVCHLRKRQGGELRGELHVMVTCSVGRVHMPESTATLMFWL